jgi:hypothetical protein
MIAPEHSVVSQHCGDPKPIISKDILPALGLNVAMDLIVAPRLDGGFVPPERERNKPAIIALAFRMSTVRRRREFSRQRLCLRVSLASCIGKYIISM